MPLASTLASHRDRSPAGPRIFLALLAYTSLLYYGSLYPFSGWHSPDTPLMRFLPYWPDHLDKGDVLQNLLVYAPFGLLCTLWLVRSMPVAAAAFMAIVLGSLVSFSVECLQQFNPTRVASTVDIVMNGLGTAGGALLSTTIVRHTFSGALILAWRDRWFRHGALTNVGLVVFGFWILSQTSPLVPTLDIGHLRHALGGLWRALHAPDAIDMARLGRYACLTTGLGIMVILMGQPAKPVITLFAVALCAVLFAKLIVINRVLSLEAIYGSALALAACLVLRQLPARLLPLLGVVMVVAGFTISEQMPGEGGGIGLPFNWIPFAGHMRTLTALEDILEFLWPFMTIGWLVRSAAPAKATRLRIVAGALLVGGGAFWLEWHQQWTPGRYGDMTQVVLCVVGWIIPWCAREAAEDGRRL